MGGETKRSPASGPPKVKREIGESVKNFEARRAAAAQQWKKDEEARLKAEADARRVVIAKIDSDDEEVDLGEVSDHESDEDMTLEELLRTNVDEADATDAAAADGDAGKEDGDGDGDAAAEAEGQSRAEKVLSKIEAEKRPSRVLEVAKTRKVDAADEVDVSDDDEDGDAAGDVDEMEFSSEDEEADAKVRAKRRLEEREAKRKAERALAASQGVPPPEAEEEYEVEEFEIVLEPLAYSHAVSRRVTAACYLPVEKKGSRGMACLAGGDGVLRGYDQESGELVWATEVERGVELRAVEFSRRRDEICVGLANGQVKLLSRLAVDSDSDSDSDAGSDVDEADLKARWAVSQSYHEHDGAVAAVTVDDTSKRGGRVALSAGSDQIVYVYDVQKKHRRIDKLVGHRGPVTCVDSGPEWIVTGGEDRRVMVWDWATCQSVHTFDVHKNVVTGVVCLDARTAVSASWDGTLQVYDLKDRIEKEQLLGHKGKVQALSRVAHWKDHPLRVASVADDGGVRLWDVPSSSSIALFSASEPQRSVSVLHKNAELLTATDMGFSVWSPDLIRTSALGCKDVTPAVKESDDDEPPKADVLAVACSADARLVACGLASGKVQVWRMDAILDVDAGEKAIVFEADADAEVWAVLFLRRDETDFLCFAGEDQHTVVFQAPGAEGEEEWKEVMRVDTGDVVLALSSSSDGSRLACAGWSSVVTIFSTKTWHQVLELPKEHEHWIHALAYLPPPNAARLVTASEDRTLRLWDARGGDCVAVFRGHEAAVTCLSVADAPHMLLASGSADQTVRVYDLQAKLEEAIVVFRGHTAPVADVCFVPGGVFLISASWDRTVRLWDLDKGTALISVLGHTDRVLALGLVPSPPTYRFLSAGKDATIRAWKIARYYTGETEPEEEVEAKEDAKDEAKEEEEKEDAEKAEDEAKEDAEKVDDEATEDAEKAEDEAKEDAEKVDDKAKDAEKVDDEATEDAENSKAEDEAKEDDAKEADVTALIIDGIRKRITPPKKAKVVKRKASASSDSSSDASSSSSSSSSSS